MTLSALIFPQGIIRKNIVLTLWPLFRYISIGRISSSSENKVIFNFITESLDCLLINSYKTLTFKQITKKIPQMELLFKYWKEWLVNRQNSGQIEILKARLFNSLEFGCEGIQFLTKIIKSYNRYSEEKKKEKNFFPLCKEEAIFLLYLLEQQNQLIEEAKILFTQTEISQKKIQNILNLAVEDDKYYSNLINYTRYNEQLSSQIRGEDNDNQLSRQLEAWATLAIDLNWSNFLLITTNVSVLNLLINRIKFQFGLGIINCSSIEEIFCLTLPELIILNKNELSIFCDKLILDRQIEKVCQDLAELLLYLNKENWSIRLKKELSRQAFLLNKELNILFINLARGSFGEVKFINRTLSLFAFPGLTHVELLKLMINYKNNKLLQLANCKSVGSVPLGLLF